jgi:hypothetical protein
MSQGYNNYPRRSLSVKGRTWPTFLAREIVKIEKSKLDGLSVRFRIPYRFYVGTETEFFDFIEQKRGFDSLGEDLGWREKWAG